MVHLGNSNGGHSIKLRSHAGPFEVVSRPSNANYIVQGGDGRGVLIHAAKILIYQPTFADLRGVGVLAPSAVGAALSRLFTYRGEEAAT